MCQKTKVFVLAKTSGFPDAAAADGRTLRSQPDPSPNAPRDQIHRKGPCCDLENSRFRNPGFWKSGNLEIWGPENPEIWGPTNQKKRILKIQIRSAQNVGKVWISTKKSTSEVIFSMDRKKSKNARITPIFLGGPMGPIHPVWALAAIHPSWVNRYNSHDGTRSAKYTERNLFL